MRFMMILKGDQQYEAGAPPKPELQSAIEQLSEEMIKARVLLDTGGLLPTAAGARLKIGGGRLSVTDGPFVETKEVIGGYAILRAQSKDDAIEMGKRFMRVHADVLGPSYEGELEIRQMADFTSDFI